MRSSSRGASAGPALSSRTSQLARDLARPASFSPGSPPSPRRPSQSTASASAFSFGRVARGCVSSEAGSASGRESLVSPSPTGRRSEMTLMHTPTTADSRRVLASGVHKSSASDGEGSAAATPTTPGPSEPPRRGPSPRSQSYDSVGRVSLAQNEKQRDSQKNFSTAQWWLSEAKRMREEALKMRRERDRFRVAVEDAHSECRRLGAQVQEFQTQLRGTQIALRESKSMADAARRELERLRHWIEEAHAESRRLSTEVQEYEWQLSETRLTLDEAERSCQELKAENEDKHAEISELRGRLGSTGQFADGVRTHALVEQLRLDVEEARAETENVRMELDAVLSQLHDERSVSDGLRGKVEELQSLANGAQRDVPVGLSEVER